MSNINYGMFTIIYKSDFLQQINFDDDYLPIKMSKFINNNILLSKKESIPHTVGLSNTIFLALPQWVKTPIEAISNSLKLKHDSDNTYSQQINPIVNEMHDLNDTINSFYINHQSNPYIPYDFSVNGHSYTGLYNHFLPNKIKILFNMFDSSTFEQSIYNCVFKSCNNDSLVFGITKVNNKASFFKIFSVKNFIDKYIHFASKDAKYLYLSMKFQRVS